MGYLQRQHHVLKRRTVYRTVAVSVGVNTGSGSVTAEQGLLTGDGYGTDVGVGDVTAKQAQITGSGYGIDVSAGDVTAEQSLLTGSGYGIDIGVGSVTAEQGLLTGDGYGINVSAGEVTAQPGELTGDSYGINVGTGDVTAKPGELTGDGEGASAGQNNGEGDVTAEPATCEGFGHIVARRGGGSPRDHLARHLLVNPPVPPAIVPPVVHQGYGVVAARVGRLNGEGFTVSVIAPVVKQKPTAAPIKIQPSRPVAIPIPLRTGVTVHAGYGSVTAAAGALVGTGHTEDSVPRARKAHKARTDALVHTLIVLALADGVDELELTFV